MRKGVCEELGDWVGHVYTNTRIHICVKQTASEKLLDSTGSSAQPVWWPRWSGMRVGWGERPTRKGAYVYVQLIHYVVQQKLTHCKATVSFIYTLIKKIKIKKLNTFFLKLFILFYFILVWSQATPLSKLPVRWFKASERVKSDRLFFRRHFSGILLHQERPHDSVLVVTAHYLSPSAVNFLHPQTSGHWLRPPSYWSGAHKSLCRVYLCKQTVYFFMYINNSSADECCTETPTR